MNPVVLDINLSGNFQSVWLQIAIDIRSGFDDLIDGVKDLCEKISGTIDEIQALQGALDGLNGSFVSLEQSASKWQTEFDEQSIAGSNISDQVSQSRQTYQPNGHDEVNILAGLPAEAKKKEEASFGETLKNVKEYTKLASSTLEFAEKYGSEMSSFMKTATKFTKGAGALLDVATTDLIFAGIESGLLDASIVDPLLLIPAAGIAIWRLLSSDEKANVASVVKNEPDDFSTLLTISAEKEQAANFLGFSKNPAKAISRIKDESYKFMSPDISLPPTVPSQLPGMDNFPVPRPLAELNRPYEEIQALKTELENKYIGKTPAEFNKEITQLREKYTKKDAGSIPTFDEMTKEVLHYLTSHAEEYKKQVLKEPHKAPRNFSSKTAPASRAATIINFTKPMIGNFTINVKDSKEGLHEFKVKVEEALLDIIKTANGQN